MNNGEYMPRSEIDENIKDIKISLERVSINIDHHDKMLQSMNEILVSQATNSEKITQAVTKITEIQSEFKEAQRENNEKFEIINRRFNKMTIRMLCLIGFIFIIANELNLDLSFLSSFL